MLDRRREIRFGIGRDDGPLAIEEINSRQAADVVPLEKLWSGPHDGQTAPGFAARLESVERSFLVFVDSNRDELHAVRVLRMLLR